MRNVLAVLHFILLLLLFIFSISSYQNNNNNTNALVFTVTDAIFEDPNYYSIIYDTLFIVNDTNLQNVKLDEVKQFVSEQAILATEKQSFCLKFSNKVSYKDFINVIEILNDREFYYFGREGMTLLILPKKYHSYILINDFEIQ